MKLTYMLIWTAGETTNMKEYESREEALKAFHDLRIDANLWQAELKKTLCDEAGKIVNAADVAMKEWCEE